MRFPRRIVFLLPALFLVVVAQAHAGKPFARRLPMLHSSGPSVRAVEVSPGPLSCALGQRQDAPTVLTPDFIIPPDDAYYTLMSVSDCATCTPTDVAFFHRVHLMLSFGTPCDTPVTITVSVIGVAGPDACPTPNLFQVICSPVSFDLPIPSQIPDTTEFALDLPQSCFFAGRAFLVINFPDTTVGCATTATRPHLVVPDTDCIFCRSYNDYEGTGPEDLCGPLGIGNPVMYAEIDSCVDLVPPLAVLDLAVDSTGASSVRLKWTATGDDGAVGLATAYELRRATSPIDDTTFATATVVSGAPAPSASGTLEKFLVVGLQEDTHYYFALKVVDEAGNTSGLSNVADTTTTNGVPAAILDLVAASVGEHDVWLRWTATGDDGTVGRPATYLIAVGELPILDANFASLVRDSAAASVDAGGIETRDISGLDPAEDYWFAIKARDDAGNVSALSNVLRTRTSVGGPIAGRVGAAIAPLSQPSRLPVPLYWQASNPTNPGRQTIQIYDLSGRLVRALPLGGDPSGIAFWDGKNDDGVSVRAGMYIARLTSGPQRARTRVVLLK